MKQLTLKDLKKKGSLYYLPGTGRGHSKEGAEDILLYNNWMGYRRPTDLVTSAVLAKIIREIEGLKVRLLRR